MWSRSSQTSDQGANNSQATSGSGGFGSFGNAPARQDGASQALPQKSGSVLSQRLDKSNAEANALRTLDARRAAEQAANAPRDIRPVPSAQPSNGQYGTNNAGQYSGNNAGQYGGNNAGQYGNNNAGQYGGNRSGQYNGTPMPAPIVVPQNNGMGNAILGFLLGRSMSNSHANSAYPSNPNNAGMAASTRADSPAAAAEAPRERSLGMSLLRTFVWLVILSVVAWLAYFGWKFLRRGKAPSTANYSFDRN